MGIMRNDHWYRAVSIDPIVEKKAVFQESFLETQQLTLGVWNAVGMLKPRVDSTVVVNCELILNFLHRPSFGPISSRAS